MIKLTQLLLLLLLLSPSGDLGIGLGWIFEG